MKSIKKIEKVLGSFDKVINELNKAQDKGLVECAKNDDKRFFLRRRFDKFRAFVFSVMNKIKGAVDRRSKKLKLENEAIHESIERAGRVKGKLEDLLK